MSESLLERYPHLKLLTRLKQSSFKFDDSSLENESSAVLRAGGISLLGPGPEVPVKSDVPGPTLPVEPPEALPRRKVFAEDLFAASVAADDDRWLQFQVDESVPAKEQLDQLKLWLVTNSPSAILKSSGIGWIAVKFKDKKKKVLEAKTAWDNHEGERNMDVINALAKKYDVSGGKWLCHLPTPMVDKVWGKLATTLLCGGLGPSVYMVKVSPVNDVAPDHSNGEHVIIAYNSDYTDTEQVMRVENLLRSAGVNTPLTYKPDIYSALGIYRNNKWGFRPTIYSSRVMLMHGKSRIEVVGTNKWYYNSSKGMELTTERDRPSTKTDSSIQSSSTVSKLKETRNVKDGDSAALVVNCARELNADKMYAEKFSNMQINASSSATDEGEVDSELPFKSMEVMKSIVPINLEGKSSCENAKGFGSIGIEDMDAMKMRECTKETRGVKSVADRIRFLAKSKQKAQGFDVSCDTVKSEKDDESKITNTTPGDVKELQPKITRQKPAWLLKLEKLQLKSMDEMV